MRVRPSRSAAFSAALALCAASLLAETPKREVLRDAEMIYLDHSDESPALRDMAPITTFRADLLAKKKLNPGNTKMWKHDHPARTEGPEGEDKVLQRSILPMVSTTAGLNFDGVGVPNYTISGAPPDTTGAIGATQYVQWVNNAFSVFNKTTGAKVYGPANGNTLWQGFGGRCETDNSGDPLVMFDRIANRWVMSQFAVSASPYYQCIAVSTTSDATGTYRRFAYQFGSDMNDYGKSGVWPDAYYISYNMFTNAQTWKGAKVCAYDRANMVSASGTPGAMQCFQLSTAYGGLLPSDLDGATLPPAGAPNYHLAFDDVNRNGLLLWKFHVDWTTPANTTFTGPTKINGAAFTEFFCGNPISQTCVVQPGTTQKLDTLADRLMYRLAYRNFGTHESLVTNHTVDVSGRGGVRWYEVRNPNGAANIHQSGTFAPDTNSRWMGSIAMDQQGNMALGYTTSGIVKPSIRYTGRLASDPLGVMQSETEMIAGGGVQTGGLNRWGDYSNMTVDPVDDCTFWYTQEYLKTNGSFNWSTRVGSFKFPGCGGAATPDYTVGASPSTMTLAAGSNGTSTITVSSLNGFNSAVSLSASGLPAGVTASFSPTSVTPAAGGSATSTLTLTASAGATSSSSTVTVTGTNGATTRTASISLTVNGAPPPGTAVYDSTLKAPKCATVGSSCDSGASLLLGRSTKGPEPNQPNTINNSCADGTSGTFHADESNDRLKVETLDGTSFAPGKTVKVTATVWAYSSASSDKLDLYYTGNASAPAWTLIATLTPPAGGAQVLTANYTLPTGGSLHAVRANFRYQGSASACSTGSYDDHDDLIFAVGGGGGGDTTAPVTSITSPTGGTVSGTVTINATASDNVAVTRVDFLVDGVVKGSDTTAPYSYAWNTTTATNASHSLTTKAYDAAANVGTSAAVSVTVNNVVSELIVNPSFEGASSSPWVRATNFNWSGTTGGRTGTGRAWAGAAATQTTTMYQTITIPTSATGAASAWLWITTAETTTTTAYDTMKVEVRNTSGTLLATLATYSNLNKSTGYVQKTFSLAAYKGQTVRLQFSSKSDVSLLTTFNIDDVSVK